MALDKGLATWVDQVIRARWAADGDRCTKLVFKSFKTLASTKQIHSLLDLEGNKASSWEDMAKVIEDFFSISLGGRADAAMMASQLKNQANVLAHAEDRITTDEKLILNAMITLGELEDAISVMKKHKCPGWGSCGILSATLAIHRSSHSAGNQFGHST